MNQNKKTIFISVFTVMVIAIVASVMLINRKELRPISKKVSTLPNNADIVPTVDSSVLVSIKRVGDGKRVKLTISSIPSGTTSIDYEFSYDTRTGVPRGVIGTITPTESTYQKEIVLGSCSTNVCTYDEGVTKVKVSLKFNLDSGSSSIFEKEFALE